MGGACGTNEVEGKYIQNFGGGKSEGKRQEDNIKIYLQKNRPRREGAWRTRMIWLRLGRSSGFL
jgi:hypothetical protein